MDIKERFKEAKFIINKIERLEKEINHINYLKKSEIQNSNISDLIDTVIITEYLNKQIEEGKAKFNYYIAELLYEMDKLDDTEEYDIIFKRYILFKSWREIEQECNYRIRLVLEIHDRALEKLNNTETTL